MVSSRVLTLDSNVLIAALKRDEPQSDRCVELIRKIPTKFVLSEPSVVYVEVCGTLARRIGLEVAEEARRQLDRIMAPDRISQCDKSFCLSAYQLCHEYELYAIDALYLKTALDNHAILVSLDKREFVDRVNSKDSKIEAFHPSQFPC
jgi:predicted nucleic acid-binding protein